VVAAAAAEPTADEAPPAATGAASSRPAPAAQGGGGWGPLVAGLDRRRAEAFASADPARLAAAVVPGSPAGRDDLAAVQALRRSGLRPVGLVWEVDAIDVVSSSATAATLRVVDHQRAYRLVDVAGRVRESRPSRAQRRWLVGLTREWPGPWRVWSVVPG
jgi:hypothetical protein